MAEIFYQLIAAEFSDVEYYLEATILLHIECKKRRGYNQSVLLAHVMIQRLQFAYAGRRLKWVTATLTQTHLTVAERMSNVSSACEVV